MKKAMAQSIIYLAVILLLMILPGSILAENQPQTVADNQQMRASPFQPPPLTAPEPQQGPPQQRDPQQPITFLSGPAAGDPLDIALDYLRRNKGRLGLTDDDLAGLVVTDRYVSSHNQVTHLYLQQRLAGIEVFNGVINLNVDREGRVLNLGNLLVSDLKNSVNVQVASLSASEAVNRAAQHLGLTLTEPLVPRRTIGGPAQEVILSPGGISLEDIPVKLVYMPRHAEARLAWQLVIRLKNGLNWWNIRVDATTGEVLSQNDWIVNDTYNVFAMPLENPDDGPRTSEVNPADPVASSFGWHDTNGVAGAEFTDTQGNNVSAQEDTNADDTGGFRPNDGGLNFNFPLNLALDPSNYQSAAITNLFYWNNILHDVHYQYGFDSVSGNFQLNTYGGGGLGSDPVQADAQDGSGTDNANFGTPPDGSDPRMQMFIWTLTAPNRDSDLDNGVIIHEYGHGVSNRLTGGPSNVSCLFNDEQMGEGWSDWWALALTAKASDLGPDPRGIGTYLLGEPLDGPGIRNFRYSTDLTVNPQTYDSIKAAFGPHDVGEVWAAMLWEVYWNLVDAHGFDPDFYNGTGGNNIAMQLVMDGLKFQQCSPSFVDGRDAILLADLTNNGGANQCRIWEGFAKRGLGFSAEDGSENSVSDGVEAFDIPPQCRDELVLTKSVDQDPAYPNALLTYTLVAGNYTANPLTGVILTDPVPADTTYVPGSASDGGSESGGVVQWNIGSMAPDTVITRTFQVTVDPDFETDPAPIFFDDIESGGGNWTATGLWHLEEDSDPCGNSFSPTTSWYYGQSPGCNYDTGGPNSGQLTTAAPIALPTSLNEVMLTFQSWERTENFSGFDTRHVLVSTDGLSFTSVFNSTNEDADWYEAQVDLSAYAGQNIWLRFEFDTLDNIANNFPGWYLDDIRVSGRPSVVNTATVTSNEGETATATTNTSVREAAILQYNPALLEQTVLLDQIVTRTVTISNLGTLPLDFSINERPANTPAALTLLGPPTSAKPGLTAANGLRLAWGQAPPPQPLNLLDDQISPAAGASLPVIIADPADDAEDIDVTNIAAASTTSAMTMRLTFDSGKGPLGAIGFIHLDTDQDSSTGLPPTALFGLPEQDIGYDYYLSLLGLPTLVHIFDADDDYMGSVSPVYLGNAFEFTIPLNVLGDDDGNMDVTMVLGSFFATEWAPDVGHGTIYDVPWLSESPLDDSVVAGDSQLVQVIFNSHAVTQTGTYSATLLFKGNMLNRVAPLPVVMHVVDLNTLYLPLIVKN